MKSEIIDVNDAGIRLDGQPSLVATDEAIAAGFMVNAPVTFRYPDGKMVQTVEGRLTPRGLQQITRSVSAGEA